MSRASREFLLMLAFALIVIAGFIVIFLKNGGGK